MVLEEVEAELGTYLDRAGVSHPTDPRKRGAADQLIEALQDLARVLDGPESENKDAQVRAATLRVRVARAGLSDDAGPPLLVGLGVFVEEFGERALNVATLGASAGVRRGYEEGRLNDQSDAFDYLWEAYQGLANGVSFGATDAFVNAYAGEGRSGFEAFRSALGTFLGGPLGVPQLRVLNDPSANPWEKAEAASALLSTYALVLAGGASIRRSRAPQRTPPGSGQDMIAPNGGGKGPPYDPKGVAADLESQYPGQVSSSTIPPPGSKNVGLAGARHPSGIVFDQRGFPIFDDLASFDTRLPGPTTAVRSRPLHFQEAARALSDAIRRGEVPASRFTAEQLRAIHGYQKKIPGLTWHHHQQPGRMQLIPTPTHQAVGHTGGFALWFE
jgi:hypothetical protein